MCYVDGEVGGERVKLCEELGFVRMDECQIDLTLGGLEGMYTHVAMVREPKKTPAQGMTTGSSADQMSRGSTPS